LDKGYGQLKMNPWCLCMGSDRRKSFYGITLELKDRASLLDQSLLHCGTWLNADQLSFKIGYG
jgi:hypothetical protein